MKQHAQAILLFTGYPLEPIVALQVKKSFQSHAPAANTVAQKRNGARKAEKSKEQRLN